MVDDWLLNINFGQITGVAFIDEILIDKLCVIGASSITLKWFKSYLSSRFQRVSYNDVVSDALPVTTEVPQGLKAAF